MRPAAALVRLAARRYGLRWALASFAVILRCFDRRKDDLAVPCDRGLCEFASERADVRPRRRASRHTRGADPEFRILSLI